MPSKEIIQDDAVCLARREFSETSLVLTFLTREHGKVTVLAKGAKRPRGKTAGGIDLLDMGVANILLNHEGLSLLREFLQGTPYPAIRNDLQKWYVILYLAEVVNLTSQELEPIPDVFKLFTKAIERSAEVTAIEDLIKVLVRGLGRLIVLIGYKPELSYCVICGRRMTTRDWLFFSESNGGLVCRDCEINVVNKRRIDQATWFYLLNKTNDLPSAAKAFDIFNDILREHLNRVPSLTSYCKKIFDTVSDE